MMEKSTYTIALNNYTAASAPSAQRHYVHGAETKQMPNPICVRQFAALGSAEYKHVERADGAGAAEDRNIST